MTEFYHQGDQGDPTGPYAESRIRDLINNGIIKGHHRLQRVGQEAWEKVSDLFPATAPQGDSSDDSAPTPDAPVEEWFYSVDAKQGEIGPVALEVLQDLVRDGALEPTAKIWKTDWPSWRDAGEVGPLKGLWPTKGGAGRGQQQDVSEDVRGPSDDSNDSRRMSTTGISSLILGLSSILFAGANVAAFLFKSWSLLIVMGLVFLLTSILAVVLGHLCLSTIKRQPRKWSGRGMGMAGLILGYVSLGATAVIGVVLLFFLIVGTAAAIPAPN